MAVRMGDKQIQTINNQDYALARRTRPRGLVGQMSMVLLEPGSFFHALPLAESSRQWVWAALLILALIGFSAVRQNALAEAAANGGGLAIDPSLGMNGGDSMASDPMLGGGGGGGMMPGGDLGA